VVRCTNLVTDDSGPVTNLAPTAYRQGGESVRPDDRPGLPVAARLRP